MVFHVFLLLFFSFSELPPDQILGDCNGTYDRGVRLGPQAVPQVHGIQGEVLALQISPVVTTTSPLWE